MLFKISEVNSPLTQKLVIGLITGYNINLQIEVLKCMIKLTELCVCKCKIFSYLQCTCIYTHTKYIESMQNR